MLLTSNALRDLLNKMDTNYFEDTLIIHQTGKILAHSGKHKDDAEMMTVITNNIWMLYSNLGSIGLKEDPLNTVMLNFAGGKLILTKVSEFLICLRSNGNVEMGLLHNSLEALKLYLEKPLKGLVE